MPLSQELTDISDSNQLLRYAAAGQLAKLLDKAKFLNNELVAQGAGFSRSKRTAGQELARALKNGLSARQVLGLDKIIAALIPELNGTGGLSSLALRLSMDKLAKEVSQLTAQVPPSWTGKLLQDPPSDEIGVLIQASALLSTFRATDEMQTSGQSLSSVSQHYKEDLEALVRRLLAVSGAPPTSRNYDAQILLGLLASYAFEPMKKLLEAELRFSPLGYRVWRAITKLVALSEMRGEPPGALRTWVQQLLAESDELRRQSLYAGRALDMELAIAVPADWSPPRNDWAGRILGERARNPAATIRERGTAAMGLWQRALRGDPSDLDRTRADLRLLIGELSRPDARPDAPAGLRWIATTLEHVIETGQMVCNDWAAIRPGTDEPWFWHVHEAADEIEDIPAHLQTGARNLFLHMILQNAGEYRSQAIETAVTSGWSLPIARALSSLLRKEQGESWLRIRAEAALGLLQQPDDPATENDLVRVCWQAYERLQVDKIPHDGRGRLEVSADEAPARAHVTEMHASLFAVGDCFGAAGAEARSARDRLQEVLTGLAQTEMPRARLLRRPARATAYLLTVTAQPTNGGKDFSQELLEKLSSHPDPVAARLSDWALRFRFAPDGSIRPLLAAADLPLEHTYPLNLYSH